MVSGMGLRKKFSEKQSRLERWISICKRFQSTRETPILFRLGWADAW